MPSQPRLYRRPVASFLILVVGLINATGAFALPSQPAGLVALDLTGQSGVHLSWEPPAGEIPAGYNIYRVSRTEVAANVTDPAAYNWILQGSTTDTFWTQANLPVDHSFEYAVSARDAGGAEGPKSPAVIFARQRFGFVLPWNDTSPSSVFDFRPAQDAHTRLTVSGGQLMRGDRPLRLVGVNICAAACFPTSAEATAVAKRMAQFGINLVRFHQFDQLKPDGVFSNIALTTLDSDQMNRLAYFIRELADNGIYSDLNLHVSRAYASADPVPSSKDKRLKGIDVFSHVAGGETNNLRQQQKKYAYDFLRRNNLHTGPFRNYPAVSIIEINNEASLLDEWTTGDFDDLATAFPTYHAELRDHWTKWLRDKYTDDARLIAAWSAAPALPAYGTVLLPATSPSPGSVVSPWQMQVITRSGAAATSAWVDGTALDVASPGQASTLKINVTQAVTAPADFYHVQLLYNGLKPSKKIPHTLRFYGKIGAGEPPREFRVALRTASGSVSYSSATLMLTPEWQEFTVCFPSIESYAGADDPAATSHSFALTGFASHTGQIYLSGFSLSTGNVLTGAIAIKAEQSTPDPVNRLISSSSTAPFNFTAVPGDGWDLPATSNGAAVSLPVFVTNGRAAGVNSLKYTITPGATPEPGDVSFVRAFYNSNALEYGESYEIRFDARVSPSAAGATFTANGQVNRDPWTGFGTSTFTTTPEWQTYVAVITVTDVVSSGGAANRIGFGLGAITGEIEFANLYVRKGGQTGLLPGESIAADGVVEPLTKSAFYGRFRAVQRDWLSFLWETELKYWVEMREYVRTSVGTSALLIGTQGEMCPNLLQDAAGFDIIDAHGYWQHPTSFNPGWTAVNTAMTGAPDLRRTTIPIRAGKRILGKPYVVSEYAHPAPNTYGTEGIPLLGAYGALQGWSGFAVFEYEHVRKDTKITWDSGFEGWLTAGRSPSKMVTFPAATSMLNRGDVSTLYDGTLAGAASVTISEATAIEIMRQTRRSDLGTADFGLDPLLAYKMPVGMKRSPDSKPADARVQPVIAPSVPFDWNAGERRLLIKTRRSKAAIGQFPETGALGLGDGVTISTPPGKLQGASWLEGSNRVEHAVKNWACFILTRTDAAADQPFGAPGTRWLLTTTGYSDNHFIRWRANLGPADNKSAVTDFGRAPSLVERITGTVSFSVPAGTLVARELDPNGEPGESLSVTHAHGIATVTLPERPETLWYHMEVIPTPWDQWRIQHFGTIASGDASGAADPDGDGLVNLAEYAFARAPLIHDNPGDTVRVVQSGDTIAHLMLTFIRRTNAQDLSYTIEVSDDLQTWRSGAAETEETSTATLDAARESVTVRDLTPLPGHNRRFMRLRVTLK